MKKAIGKPLEDLTGKRFGELTVIEYAGGSKWLCKCDCGETKIIQGSALKSEATKSCGCLNSELSAERIGSYARVHGYSNKERLYEIWKNMKYRCYNSNDNRYAFYGGKGVTVCDDWKNDYISFRNWAMANGYTDDLSIDRIDNDGNYEPNNCRWANQKQQANNQSRNRILEYKGVKKIMSEWADDLGLTYGAMNHRIQRDWSMERIVNTPLRE